jgi:hypothetical protein
MKKSIVILICLVAVSMGVIVVAYAGGLFSKKPIYNDKTQKYELIENYEKYITERKTPFDEGKCFDSIPVYDSSDLLYNTADSGFFLGRDAGFYSLTPNTRRDFSRIIFTAYPTDAIRETSKSGNVYALYDTDIGVRVFLFFSKEKNNYMTLDGFPVIMQKKLEYKDFTYIKKGDSIKIVENIDSIITQYIRHFDTISDDFLDGYSKKGAGATSIHLLTDGILKIVYERTNGDYVITNIMYSKDFVLEGLDGKTCYKISELDYLK